MAVVDALLPPQKRTELFDKIKSFTAENPKIAVFLLANVALSGPPLFLFAVFTLSVFVFTLIFALLVAVLVALLFTAFMLVVALVFILPTVFITTMGASFLFLWGLGGYYIFKWFNEGASPAPLGAALGDKLNTLMGGRLDFLMKNARAASKPNGKTENGSADEKSGLLSDNSNKASNGGVTDAADVKKGPPKLNKTANVDGVSKKTAGATDTVKGVTGGVTSG
ncbi:hypothetical protein P152DRAFT_398295 [Eremomyces bilateralis CBS 781.70]|uniref:Uncharacterized protein n=1 Tax=Eremomyces bilateralis CBS 781.70 TaxID=1392243 RepID=A0A6G1G1X5_9PEZI|nr:uncharacterized protein P152DRAFT_398295 [Eremomyces bilateralis CBS 781.70]KAF1811926.1 hypothetical protein P152DRAFT_398295 [Eremomyces bilateralis CBS 781.70]